jgi:hypothetical protein
MFSTDAVGEILTRFTIWIAITAYVSGVVIFALSGRNGRWDSLTRIVWTTGCAGLLAHFVCAFHFYHGWSQESAYRETARQTAAIVGLNWGGGLFINYFVLVAWVVDVSWWWWKGVNSYRRRPWQVLAAWHGFLIFIIINATIVFKTGVVRWTGVALSAVICLGWLHVLRQPTKPSPTAIAKS